MAGSDFLNTQVDAIRFVLLLGLIVVAGGAIRLLFEHICLRWKRRKLNKLSKHQKHRNEMEMPLRSDKWRRFNENEVGKRGIIWEDLLNMIFAILLAIIACSIILFLGFTIAFGDPDDEEIKNAAIEYEKTTGRPLAELNALITQYNDQNGNYHKPLLKRLHTETYLFDPENKIIKSEGAISSIFYGDSTFKINKILSKYNLTSEELIPSHKVSKDEMIKLICALENGSALFFEIPKVVLPVNDIDSIILLLDNEKGESEVLTLKEIMKYDSYTKKVIYNKELINPVVKIIKVKSRSSGYSGYNIEIEIPDKYLSSK